jgi:hypothetical protein
MFNNSIWVSKYFDEEYTLTDSKILIKKGFFNIECHELYLYRIHEAYYTQNIFQKLLDIGDIHLLTDTYIGKVVLRNVKMPFEIFDMFSYYIELYKNERYENMKLLYRNINLVDYNYDN